LFIIKKQNLSHLYFDLFSIENQIVDKLWIIGQRLKMHLELSS